MSILSSILNGIFGRKAEASDAATPAPPPADSVGTTAPATSAAPQVDPVKAETGQPSPSTAPVPPQLDQADVEAILTELAAKKGGGGNWKTSIVDLLKLLDLDSSLNARKELASELNVHAGEHGSAEQNIALSKAVWQKLAENGGKVPASLMD